MVHGKTVVIITHKFTTASQADLIYVMEDGEIVENGSHNELLENEGSYASSWREQMIKFDSVVSEPNRKRAAGVVLDSKRNYSCKVCLRWSGAANSVMAF